MREFSIGDIRVVSYPTDLGDYTLKQLENGTYEDGALALINQFGKGKFAIEFGAGLGITTVALRRRFKIVHAYEPVKEYAACLSKNLAANGVRGRVKIYVAQLTRGTLHIRDEMINTGLFSSQFGTITEARNLPLTEQLDLLKDVLMPQHQTLHNPDTLVLDVEGAEIYIDPTMLPGIRQALVEFHEFIHGRQAVERMIAGWQRAGWEIVARAGWDTPACNILFNRG